MALEETQLQQYLTPYLSDDHVSSMDTFIQHGTTTTLQHALSVTRVSCAIASRLHLNVNYRDLVAGALLHDFYLYDWHDHKTRSTLHGFAHPHIACRNARLHFRVNPQVQHIISTHMWPLTLRSMPRSKEAFVVCAADKYCSTLETVVVYWRMIKTLGKKGGHHQI